MSELFSQLGIDPKLLLAQGFNFVVLLLVLTRFVYRPLMKLVQERRDKIELGIRGGEMAKEIIQQAQDEKAGILKDADIQAISVISEAEKTAKKKAQDIALMADRKAKDALQQAMLLAERKEKEEMDRVSAEARKLIKDAIIKTVQLKPEQVDEKLIDQAVKSFNK